MNALMVLFAYPALKWTLVALIVLAGTPVHQVPWESGGDYGYGEIRLAHLDDARTLLHETNHRMQEYYGLSGYWKGFIEAALPYLNRDQLASFKYYCTFGPAECHAELPYLLDGHIPRGLAIWYPWFNLTTVKAKVKFKDAR